MHLILHAIVRRCRLLLPSPLIYLSPLSPHLSPFLCCQSVRRFSVAVPLSSSLVEPSKPPRHSPPPSSSSAFASPLLPSSLSAQVSSILVVDSPAPNPSGPCSPCGAVSTSGSRVRLLGLCSPPSPDVSCVSVADPCLAGADIVNGLGELDVEVSGLPVGSQTCSIPSNRSPTDHDGLDAAKDAIISVQMGSPVSLDPIVPARNPSVSARNQQVHQLTQGGLSPPDSILECGHLGSQLVCPDPSQISSDDDVAGKIALQPVSSPVSSASPSVSWASIVGKQETQVVSSKKMWSVN